MLMTFRVLTTKYFIALFNRLPVKGISIISIYLFTYLSLDIIASSILLLQGINVIELQIIRHYNSIHDSKI